MGDAGAAIRTLEDLKARWPDYQSAEGHLLYATALEKAGRNDEALANYAAVGQYFPGAEPRVRQAELLQRLGRDGDARELAQDIVRTLTRAPAHVRRNQRQWLASAQKLARS
ncbi:MAG: tetratricopeptide repeat protein [Roseiarcus sp.]